ncbi:FkbM family methyltransferase [uncultured Roseobacter sp.]|uniref:FkbM family methyltransferase n=1 Tax=uncultured Roseobacter sp. TaxID=114847 RepID=UPI00260752A2|nr:FkbM family methyltransferase [uncultured Roseobacter sp.]
MEISQTQRLFDILKSLSLTPTHIVDVSANHGNWSRAALTAFPTAKLSVFEPQKQLAEKHTDLAQNERVALHYKGLGDFDGSAPFTFHPRDDSSSFLYSASEASAQGYEQNEVEICKLDTAMAASEFGMPEIVKIDAEGLDLKVLDGAPETISKAQVILIEATVACPEYPNTAAIVFQKMDALGFRLFDITDLNRTPERGILWLIEAVFIRKGSSLDTAATVYK